MNILLILTSSICALGAPVLRQAVCCILSKIQTGSRRLTYLANEARNTLVTLFLPNQLSAAEEGKDHWVQLSPFGDFGNRTGNTRVIQRFRKEDAEQICNDFNGVARRITQPLGMPFYIGHPDHPVFRNQPGHGDTRSYGQGDGGAA